MASECLCERREKREKRKEIRGEGEGREKERINNCYLILQHALVQFYQYNCIVAILLKMLKLLAFETPHEPCFLVFDMSDAKNLTFDTFDANALSGIISKGEIKANISS